MSIMDGLELKIPKEAPEFAFTDTEVYFLYIGLWTARFKLTGPCGETYAAWAGFIFSIFQSSISSSFAAERESIASTST